jgi:thiamine biosynthesis lipoprotein
VHRIEVRMSTATAATGYWGEIRARGMGSEIHVVLGDAPPGLAKWARCEVERLEQCWSRFRRDSELGRLHDCAGTWTPVSASLLLAFTCASDLFRATSGLFDPTIRDALERAGYSRSFADLPHAEDSCPPFVAHAAPGFGCVDIDVERSCVRIPAGVKVDLGGVGKGLAADLIARGLVDRGARCALVSLGGDMRARGEHPDGAWNVPVEDPRDEGRIAFRYPIANRALVTSTTLVRAWMHHGRQYHHLFDPFTGDASRSNVVAAVATARDAWWAEGIAKAMVIGGVAYARELVQRTDVTAWLFLDDGAVVAVEQ